LAFHGVVVHGYRRENFHHQRLFLFSEFLIAFVRAKTNPVPGELILWLRFLFRATECLEVVQLGNYRQRHACYEKK
jgi:hypothetical protein